MAYAPFIEIDDNLADSGDLISVEMFKQLAENCNYLIDSMPIGSIIPILVGFGSTPVPDPSLWKECDGSEITVEASELRNQPAPDYASAGGRYMRGYVSGGQVGFYGGSNTKNLIHNHGGTQVFSPPTAADSDDDYFCPGNHAHPVNNDLQTNHNFEPVHYRIKHYIKIA